MKTYRQHVRCYPNRYFVRRVFSSVFGSSGVLYATLLDSAVLSLLFFLDNVDTVVGYLGKVGFILVHSDLCIQLLYIGHSADIRK